MPIEYNRSGYPSYIPSDYNDDDDYYLRAVLPSPRHTPSPSPQGSPNLSPMYLDPYYNYVQPGTGVIGVPMVPAGIIPFPPSPSALGPAFVPLPPSPNASPRLGAVPLASGVQYQQPQYTFPYDPYYFPQAGIRYNNPHYPPRSSVHPLLKNGDQIRLDLSLHNFAPQMLTGNWMSRTYTPVHQGYLVATACYPSTTEMKITCKSLGRFTDTWAVVVKPGRTIAVGDVLHAVHATFQIPLTHAEWAVLTERERYVVGKSYTRRCTRAEFEQIKGARRVDLLDKKYWFGGLKKIRDEDPHNFELLIESH